MIILKPQWLLRCAEDGRYTLTSEDNHFDIPENQGLLILKLASGVPVQDLTDQEFSVFEDLSNRGFLGSDANPDSSAWELSGANFHYVSEQFEHMAFRIVDSTENAVGESLRAALLESGIKEDLVAPKIILSVTDSFQSLHEDPTVPVLPIVCNRLRTTIGPVVFSWSPSLRERILQSPHYMPHPNYKLPPVFDRLQREWISVSVLQFFGMSRLRYVDNFVEYNMGKQEFRIWPAK